MKRIITTISMILVTGLSIPAQDLQQLSVAAYPAVQIPIGPGLAVNGGESPYTIGTSFGIDADYLLGGATGFFARGNLSYSYLPVIDGASSDTDNLALLGLGIGTGFQLTPGQVSPLSIRLYGMGGYYLGLYSGESAGNLFAKGGLESSFSLSPGFALGAGAEYGRFFSPATETLPNYLYDGVSVRFSGTYRLGAGNRKALIEFINIEIKPVFPILYGYYDSNPIGTAIIKNREPGPIQDIEVSFFIPEYMSQPKVSAVIPELQRNEQTEVPLYALLSDDILEVTEDGKRVNGEISIAYTYRGNTQTHQSGSTATVQNRNALTWTDDRKAAAFITAKDNTVLRFAKNIAGEARGGSSRAIDPNFRQAVAVYEALGLHGMRYVIDPASSYIELSKDGAAQDYVQFPAQTLDYRAGDCDDLSILYVALLEAVNVETALVTVPGHIFTAFALDLTPGEARKTFSSTEDLIIREDQVWIPVEATVMEEGFLRAWQEGARQWREHAQTGAAGFYPVRDAWNEYIPVPSPLADPGIEIPDPDRAQRLYLRSLEKVVEREISDRVDRLERQIQDSNGNAALVNKLGVLYARYGLFDKALAQFESLTGRKAYIPAIVNTANIYFLRQNYARALGYYTQAHEQSPDNSTALLGIARAQYQLENYTEARNRYAEVEEVNPDLASRFAHLGGGDGDSSRASSATDAGLAVWED